MVDVLTLFTLKVSSIRATKENFGEVTVFKLYVFEVLYSNFDSMFLISINSKTSVSIPWIRNSRNTGQVQTKLKKKMSARHTLIRPRATFGQTARDKIATCV